MNFLPPKCALAFSPPAVVVLSLILLIATGPACRSGRGDAALLRIVDLVKEENVIRSPLMKPDSANSSLTEISGMDLLEDLGTGPNPYKIKRKLHVGPSDVNALVAVPPTEIRFRLKVPPNARMEFNYGLRHDAEIFRAKTGERRAEFKLILSSGVGEEKLFQKSLSLRPGRALVFDSKEIDLSGRAGENLEIRLITEGDGKALAFWFNPIVYRARDDARYVILVSLDTLRADHLTCYGYSRDTSPNMDALARDGARFVNSFSAAPWTLPSHISLITGLSVVNHGVESPEFRLNPAVSTVAEMLRAKDFYCAALTGGGYVSDFYGFDQGFDSFRVIGSVTGPDAAEALRVNACRWLKKNQNKNLFLFLHTYQIHPPFYCPEPFNRRYLGEGAKFDRFDTSTWGFSAQNRFKPLAEDLRTNIIDLYDAEIRYTDETLIGGLVAELKSLGLYDRTMIVVTSDHGEEFFEHGAWIHTHSVYNEVTHVPLIIKFFNSRHAGRTFEAPVSGVDVMPTICGEFGIDTKSASIDGIDLAGRLRKKGDAGSLDRVLVSDLASRLMNKHIPGKIALVKYPYKFIFNMPYAPEDLSFFSSPPPPLAETELYDLPRDAGESSNLAGRRPDLVRQFRELLKKAYRPRKKVGARKEEISKEFEKVLKSLGYL
jgi:arylsulfatase A-like enzyme